MAAPPYQANPLIGLEPTQDYGSNPAATGPTPSVQAATLVDPPQGLLGQCVGQYRVIRELGRGGMGVVYKAEHAEIGQRAALKTLHPEISSNPQFRRRFLNGMRPAPSPRPRRRARLRGMRWEGGRRWRGGRPSRDPSHSHSELDRRFRSETPCADGRPEEDSCSHRPPRGDS